MNIELENMLKAVEKEAKKAIIELLDMEDNIRTEKELLMFKLNWLNGEIKHNAGTWNTGAVSAANVTENIKREMATMIRDRLIQGRVTDTWLEGWRNK